MAYLHVYIPDLFLFSLNLDYRTGLCGLQNMGPRNKIWLPSRELNSLNC